MSKVSFGIDFGGLTTKKTTLVRADLSESNDLYFTIINNHPLMVDGEGLNKIKRAREEIFKPVIDSNRNIYVDVPIDLQNLKIDVKVDFSWELIKRPVDYVFGAISPLGDLLGSMVATFRYLLLDPSIPKSLADIASMKEAGLGKRVFETYPKQSIKHLTGLKGIGYKNSSIIYNIAHQAFMAQKSIEVSEAEQRFYELGGSLKAKYLYQLLRRNKESGFELLSLFEVLRKTKPSKKQNINKEEIKAIRDYILAKEDNNLSDARTFTENYNLKEIKTKLVEAHMERINQKINIESNSMLLEVFNKVFEGKKFNCENGVFISDDEFDAIVCSMTGLLPNMSGGVLNSYVNEQLKSRGIDKYERDLVPEGYCLLTNDSLREVCSINIKKCNWNKKLLTGDIKDFWEI